MSLQTAEANADLTLLLNLLLYLHLNLHLLLIRGSMQSRNAVNTASPFVE